MGRHDYFDEADFSFLIEPTLYISLGRPSIKKFKSNMSDFANKNLMEPTSKLLLGQHLFTCWILEFVHSMLHPLPHQHGNTEY